MNEEARLWLLLAPIPGGGLNSTNLPHPIASARRLCWPNRTASVQNAFYANSIKGRAGGSALCARRCDFSVRMVEAVLNCPPPPTLTFTRDARFCACQTDAAADLTRGHPGRPSCGAHESGQGPPPQILRCGRRDLRAHPSHALAMQARSRGVRQSSRPRVSFQTAQRKSPTAFVAGRGGDRAVAHRCWPRPPAATACHRGRPTCGCRSRKCRRSSSPARRPRQRL